MAAVAEPPRPDRDQGVFETLLVLDGQPVELGAHLTRLETSLTELFPDHPAPDLSAVDVAHPQTGDALESMRLTVAPNGGGELRTQISVREVERGLFFSEGRVALHSLPLAGGLGAHKWADRSLLDGAQGRLSVDALPLLTDSDGTVLEASRANVFAVRGGSLLTPPADGRILPGVTRMRVLEIAVAAGLETGETELSHADLLAADEIFLTGSVRGVERVRAVDGTPLSNGGEVADRVAAELRRAWAGAKFE
jgi:para-aminobenzoate synthetase/4-amino-4-deoxychorismate lyase